MCDAKTLLQRDVGPDKRAIYERYLSHVTVLQKALRKAAIQDKNPSITATGVTTDQSIKPQCEAKETSHTFAGAATDKSDVLTHGNFKNNETQTEVPYPTSQPMDVDAIIDEVLLTTDLTAIRFKQDDPGMTTHHVLCTSVNPPTNVKERAMDNGLE